MVSPGRRRAATLAPALPGILLALCPLTVHPQEPATGRPGEARDPAQLDVTLVVFAPGVATDLTGQRASEVFPRVRAVEAAIVPFRLRETLVATDQWGAVRVVPQAGAGTELQITGAILRSDGLTLSLAIRAVDSTGRVWLDDTYSLESESTAPSDPNDDDDVNKDTDPFQPLYDRIVADLHNVRAGLDTRALATIADVALLRYAGDLSGTAFGEYLENTADGTLVIVRLPAAEDPLFARVHRIRRFEYLFTDSLDEQYRQLHEDVAPTYDLWRKYRRRLAGFRAIENERLQTRKSAAPRGSFAAIRKRYEDFKWARLSEQHLAEWAERFSNEIAPTVVQVDERVVELGGDLDSRYAEWRRILTAIFDIETAEPPRTVAP